MTFEYELKYFVSFQNQGEEDTFIAESSDEDENILVTDGIPQDEDLHGKHKIKISISKMEILTLILAFSLRYQLSDTAIVSLIEMVNIIICKKLINPSLYRLWKIFNGNNEKTVKTHFFCEKCYTYLCYNKDNKFTICDVCEVQTDNAQSRPAS